MNLPLAVSKTTHVISGEERIDAHVCSQGLSSKQTYMHNWQNPVLFDGVVEYRANNVVLQVFWVIRFVRTFYALPFS